MTKAIEACDMHFGTQSLQRAIPPNAASSERASPPKHVSRSSLADVVGFTDPSGQTCCAVNEKGNYLLRTIGLVKGAERAREELLPLTDEKSVRGSLQDKMFPNSLNKQESLLVEAARPAYEEALAKQKPIEAELERVIRLYVEHLSPMVCEDVLSMLPLELREMIYTHIGIVKEHAFINVYTSRHSPCEPVYAIESKSTNTRLCRPWYFDSGIVGDEMERETLATWYRCALFKFCEMRMLQPFLATEMWGPVTPVT